MDYEVILTYPAKAQFDHVINYILCEFESEQAALSVLNDAEDTKSRLAHVAGSLKLCDDPKLRALGYRTCITEKRTMPCACISLVSA